jgi:hypothetical protein
MDFCLAIEGYGKGESKKMNYMRGSVGRNAREKKNSICGIFEII